jgi:hypothetical protein
LAAPKPASSFDHDLLDRAQVERAPVRAHISWDGEYVVTRRWCTTNQLQEGVWPFRDAAHAGGDSAEWSARM